MYSVMRKVKEDPLCGNVVRIIENMEELEEYIERLAQRVVTKYAVRYNASHILTGFLLRIEELHDYSGLKVVFEYWQVPGDPAPANTNAHVFKDPESSATLIREYGEHEDTNKQVAERMGAIGKPVYKRAYQGMSLDFVIKELDDLGQRFVKESDEVSIKHMGRPVTYEKPKRAPPTDRGNFKGYKKWER